MLPSFVITNEMESMATSRDYEPEIFQNTSFLNKILHKIQIKTDLFKDKNASFRVLLATKYLYQASVEKVQRATDDVF